MQLQFNENAIGRDFQSQMQELQYKQQLGTISAQEKAQLAKMQLQFNENAIGRDFQSQMQELQYKQQLGTIGAQEQAQLVQMERNAQLTTQRDELLQKYNKELTVINNDQRWKETLFQADVQFQQLAKQFDQQTKLTYANSQTQIMAEMMSAIGQAMTNPNMTTAQQQAMVDQIRSTFSQQASALAVVFGAKAPTAPALPGTNTGVPTNTNPPIGINPGAGGGDSGGGGGGGGTDVGIGGGLFLP